MEGPQFLYVFLILSTFLVCVRTEGQNKTKFLIANIIKEQPHIQNNSSINTSSIKPTKVLISSSVPNELQQSTSNQNSLVSNKSIKTNNEDNQHSSQKITNNVIIINDSKNMSLKWPEPTESSTKVMLVGADFYDIEYFDMDFRETDNFLDEPEPPDFGDFDELQRDADFNMFGSNFKSEIYQDKDDFDYYQDFDQLLNEMNNKNRSLATPEPNKIPDFAYDEEYGDFGTLYSDEELTDYEDYCESLRYFHLLDRLTRRGGKPKKYKTLQEFCPELFN